MLQQGRFVEHAVPDQGEVLEQYAFLIDAVAESGHGARGGAADIRMMAARGHVEIRFSAVAQVHGAHHREVRQVCAAGVGRVQQEGVAACGGFAMTGFRVDHRAYALAHGTKVNGHVRCVGDQSTVGAEYGAGEIQALLDVHGRRRVLEHRAHLLGDVPKAVVEQLEQHRVRRVGTDPLIP